MSEEQIEINFVDSTNSRNDGEDYLEKVIDLKAKVRNCFQSERMRKEENKSRFATCVNDINQITKAAKRIDLSFKEDMERYSTDESDLLKPRSLLWSIISYFFVILFIVMMVKFMQHYGSYMSNRRNYDPRLPPPV